MKNPSLNRGTMEKVTIVLPVKDEEVGLKFLLDDFRSSNIEQDFEIQFFFVIDERTSDNSLKMAEKFAHQTIDQSSEHGKGSAIRHAVKKLKIDEEQFVVFLDADGSYSFKGVRMIIDALRDGCDVSSGSRFLSKSGRPQGMSRLHNFGNRSLSLISSMRNRRYISDLCTGLWGFTTKALRKIEIKSKGFDLEAEIAGQTRKHGLLHKEVPVDWSQRKGGTSKLRSIRDGAIILSRIIFT